jgi:hypothetical protein
MILPTKGLAVDRALLSVGAEVLHRLDRPKTVSRLWDQVRQRQSSLLEALPYDWFLLALDLLYLWGAVTFEDGQLRRTHRRTAR